MADNLQKRAGPKAHLGGCEEGGPKSPVCVVENRRMSPILPRAHSRKGEIQRGAMGADGEKANGGRGEAKAGDAMRYASVNSLGGRGKLSSTSTPSSSSLGDLSVDLVGGEGSARAERLCGEGVEAGVEPLCVVLAGAESCGALELVPTGQERVPMREEKGEMAGALRDEFEGSPDEDGGVEESWLSSCLANFCRCLGMPSEGCENEILALLRKMKDRKQQGGGIGRDRKESSRPSKFDKEMKKLEWTLKMDKGKGVRGVDQIVK